MLIGTAGHIDHGKTALVKALTGVDADRLPEEKARGITLDLGYAYVPLPDGTVLGFVDVPGHERLVHNMLAGATGIDFALRDPTMAQIVTFDSDGQHQVDDAAAMIAVRCRATVPASAPTPIPTGSSVVSRPR